jgi:hypothetical protein|tara:strand:- start:625 stop:882 length:258 start_codon:yes stop_codon:yes gene_type:complete
MKKYTISVNEDVKEAILLAVENYYKNASSKVNTSYRCEAKEFDDWVNSNKPELTRIKEATLLLTELGYGFKWEIVDNDELENSAE